MSDHQPSAGDTERLRAKAIEQMMAVLPPGSPVPPFVLVGQTAFHAGMIEYQQREYLRMQGEVEALKKQVGKLQAFKSFVHRRLDEAGIPTHPEGEHAAAGCRVGERLRVFQEQRDTLATEIERLRKGEGSTHDNPIMELVRLMDEHPINRCSPDEPEPVTDGPAEKPAFSGDDICVNCLRPWVDAPGETCAWSQAHAGRKP